MTRRALGVPEGFGLVAHCRAVSSRLFWDRGDDLTDRQSRRVASGATSASITPGPAAAARAFRLPWRAPPTGVAAAPLGYTVAFRARLVP